MADWLPLTADQVEEAVGYLFCGSSILLALAGVADWLWPVKTNRERRDG